MSDGHRERVCFHFIIHNSSFSLDPLRVAVLLPLGKLWALSLLQVLSPAKGRNGIDWLDLGRAIQLSDVLTTSFALNPDSKTAECQEARKHENAACYERRLPDGISATEEYADETDNGTDNADANV
jgi:hypothetical protein